MIDPATLLAGLRALLRDITDDIRERATEVTETHAELQAEHGEAVNRGRTAATFGAWRDERVTQAAVGWLITSTFVRFTEDNGLVDEHRLAGPGRHLARARDAQVAYFQAHPHHTDRDYLLDAFDRVARLPGMGDLFDKAHNPLYQLEVSGDGASRILAFWRQHHDDKAGDDVRLVHDFTDDDLGTRFLGDLYQDLSDDAKKRYALLQTPDFVEEFILDRTLTPAIETFGLAGTHLIDPTCGSGHFLLGTFHRILEAWRHQEPATDVRELAKRSLAQVAGVDINPFAVAIARFRLLVAALRACGITRLQSAPDFTVLVAVGDSLLHSPQQQLPGMLQVGVSSFCYRTEDSELLNTIFARSYEAVAGNPPYIQVHDRAAKANYRERYDSCYMQYSLGVTFTERFLKLARPRSGVQPAGYIGMITANSFIKRQFGKKLIEQILPEKDLTTVIDLSGMDIPGHGTPTAILFARNQWPVQSTVRMALGIRGEPPGLDDPAKSLVWQSIVNLLDNAGSENAYVSICDIARGVLARHPWSIGGGGAAELKSRIEEASQTRLHESIASISAMSITRADDAYISPPGCWHRLGVSLRRVVPLVDGSHVRDWQINDNDESLFPYDESLSPTLTGNDGLGGQLWLNKQYLLRRVELGGTHEDLGLTWYEWSRFLKDRYQASIKIAFAFVATHNHFVLVDADYACNRHAQVIKLDDSTTREQHFALLGLLDSSVACFWMQQVFHNKGGPGGAHSKDEKWHDFYEFDATKLKQFPVVEADVTEYARRLHTLAQEAGDQTPAGLRARETPTRAALDQAQAEWQRIRSRQIAIQEELDWRCLYLYGVTEEDLTFPLDEVPSLSLGERAFEIVLARKIAAKEEESVWFERHRSTPITDIPAHWPEAYRQLVEKRIALIESDRDVGLVERPENKRRWATDPWEKQEQAALRGWLLDRFEARGLWFEGNHPRVQSVARLTDRLRRDPEVMGVLELYAGAQADPVQVVEELVLSEAVPAVAAARYKPSGMRKRAEWEATWDLQRREDAGEEIKDIPVPPKYAQADFRRPEYWKARGKLDVPKERFVLYPEAERDSDATPVVGWAGWDHLQQATAVATYAIERQESEGWEGPRLRPLLAAWHEVLPWVRQWHDEPDPDTGLRMGEFFTGQLDVRLQEVGLTVDDLRAWEPTARRRRPKAKANGNEEAKATPGAGTTAGTEAALPGTAGGDGP